MRTRVGYAGGTTPSPTYHRIGDHAEVFQVDYDPSQLSYADLVRMFWAAHDPTRNAYSTQYQSALFFEGPEEQRIALEVYREVSGLELAALRTRVAPLDAFYRAEDYHQKYRLRTEGALVAELIRRYGDDRTMVDSTCAARLNGYLSGYGRRRDLIELLPRLSLSPNSERTLLARVS